ICQSMKHIANAAHALMCLLVALYIAMLAVLMRTASLPLPLFFLIAGCIFLLGMLLSFVYARTGKIHHCILIHMAVNFFGGVLPVIVMNWADYDTLMALIEEFSANPAVQMLETIGDHVISHPAGTICLFLFIFAQYALAALGVVFLIIHRRKFVLKKSEEQLPTRMGLRAAILNPGVIAALVVCIYLFISSLMSAVVG
ncbi:MAG: hypothetical protein IKW66_02560, partial [Clostridia bacterium]|nr:hypothetical protein [Clostridia bacterium]